MQETYTSDLMDLIDFDINVGKTIYRYNGKQVPRVSDIMSKTINEEYIILWSNSLGWRRKKYKEELQSLAQYGSMVHEAIYRFLHHGEECDNVSFLAFLDWWNDINAQYKVKILGTEQSLVCQWFGGTYDLLIKINDKIFLVDYKTSNKITYRHAIQTSAYRNMLYNLQGINIDGIIILQLDKKYAVYRDHVFDFTNTDHYNYIEQCTRTFYSLVYAYYNTTYTRDSFKDLVI